jgi:hypothetical protein
VWPAVGGRRILLNRNVGDGGDLRFGDGRRDRNGYLLSGNFWGEREEWTGRWG